MGIIVHNVEKEHRICARDDPKSKSAYFSAIGNAWEQTKRESVVMATILLTLNTDLPP